MVGRVVRPVAVIALVLSGLLAACAGVPEAPGTTPVDSSAQPLLSFVPAATSTAPSTDPTRVPAVPSAPAASPISTAPPTEPSISEPPRTAPELITPGSLVICMSFNRARFAERDASGDPIGADVELAQALAGTMGVIPAIVERDFDQLIDVVVAGSECDISVSGQFITQSRLDRIDMLPYREGIPHVVVKIGNPLGIETLTDLCGHTFGVVAGTVYVDMVNGTGDFVGTGIDDQCQAAAAAAVDLHEYADQKSAEDAISAGEVNAYAGNDFIVRDRPGEFEWAVELPRIRNGIGHRLDSPVLDEELRAGLREMIDDGTYLEILEKYGVQELALTVRP